LRFLSYAGKHREFKFGVWVEHSKSQPTDDKPSLKWAWSRDVIRVIRPEVKRFADRSWTFYDAIL